MPEIILIGAALAFVLVAVGAWVLARRSGWATSEHTVQSTDEDADAFGTEVEVIEAVSETQQGRIHFRGTSWPARTVHGRIEAGGSARLVDRDNVVWIVEPLTVPKPNP